MTRRVRPLATALSPDERLVAFERRIRDYQAATDDLAAALETLETCPPRELDDAARAVRAAAVALQELNARPIRRPETVARRQAPAEPAR